MQGTYEMLLDKRLKRQQRTNRYKVIMINYGEGMNFITRKPTLEPCIEIPKCLLLAQSMMVRKYNERDVSWFHQVHPT